MVRFLEDLTATDEAALRAARGLHRVEFEEGDQATHAHHERAHCRVACAIATVHSVDAAQPVDSEQFQSTHHHPHASA